MGKRKQKGIRQGRWLTYHLSHYLKQRLSAAEHLPPGSVHIHSQAESESVEQGHYRNSRCLWLVLTALMCLVKLSYQ